VAVSTGSKIIRHNAAPQEASAVLLYETEGGGYGLGWGYVLEWW